MFLSPFDCFRLWWHDWHVCGFRFHTQFVQEFLTICCFTREKKAQAFVRLIGVTCFSSNYGLSLCEVKSCDYYCKKNFCRISTKTEMTFEWDSRLNSYTIFPSSSSHETIQLCKTRARMPSPSRAKFNGLGLNQQGRRTGASTWSLCQP